jgi:hypothetical protein
MKNLVLFAILIFTIAELTFAQQKNPLIINLGQIDPGKPYYHNETGNVTFQGLILQNAVVGFTYSIRIEKQTDSLPPLSFPKINPDKNKVVRDSCDKLRSAINEVTDLYQAETQKKFMREHKGEIIEKELAKRISLLQEEQKKSNCPDLHDQVEDIISQSNRFFNEKIVVGTGETLTITIKRDNLEWSYIIKGKPLGKWMTSYGFGFTPASLENKTFYTKQVLTDTSKFQILKSRCPSVLDLNYVPAVFFSYFPSQNFNKQWNHSLTAGLGFDLSSPVIFVGYNMMFWNNIGFSVGVVFQQQYRLKNQYSENEIIPVSLEKDQLHDKVYRPNIFLSIHYRFGENPFKTIQSEATEK